MAFKPIYRFLFGALGALAVLTWSALPSASTLAAPARATGSIALADWPLGAEALSGRVLYEQWAAYWPEHADEPFGEVMNGMKKYVLSSSLSSADWQNSEINSGDMVREIKAQDGGDISMSGSTTTVRWLLREGLLDELNLLVHPLALLKAETFKSGVLNLSYGPAT